MRFFLGGLGDDTLVPDNRSRADSPPCSGAYHVKHGLLVMPEDKSISLARPGQGLVDDYG